MTIRIHWWSRVSLTDAYFEFAHNSHYIVSYNSTLVTDSSRLPSSASVYSGVLVSDSSRLGVFARLKRCFWTIRIMTNSVTSEYLPLKEVISWMSARHFSSLGEVFRILDIKLMGKIHLIWSARGSSLFNCSRFWASDLATHFFAVAVGRLPPLLSSYVADYGRSSLSQALVIPKLYTGIPQTR